MLQSNRITIKFGTAEARRLNWALLVLEIAKQNPNLGSRKLADHFEIGKTQIQAILKNKEAIIDAYASNETPNHAKRKRSSKYSDVNQAV